MDTSRPRNREAVEWGAGAVCAAVDDAMQAGAGAGGAGADGAAPWAKAFCAVRPPGHQAKAAGPMGYCVLNHVAIGAARARRVHGARKVAVVDFDAHHGNGTQEYCERAGEELFFASVHRSSLFPHKKGPSTPAAAVEEAGAGGGAEGAGLTLNVALNGRAGNSAAFRAAIGRIVRALEAYQPELLLLSAGFDGHRGEDNEHTLGLSAEDYGWATAELAKAADALCGGRCVSVLEGGYKLASLAECVAAHVCALGL